MKSTAEQHRAINIHQSIWVSASAGSGKTFVLVNRVMALLLNGVQPGEILCISFTETAASTMKNRISSKLCQWSYLSDAELRIELEEVVEGSVTQAQLTTARQLLTTILDSIDGLNIMSFHAFCRSIIKRFPFEAGVMPKFDIADDNRKTDLLQRAKQRFFLHYASLETRPQSQPNILTLADEWMEVNPVKALQILTTAISSNRLDELLTKIFDNRKRLYPFLQDEYGLIAYQQQLATATNLSPRDFHRDFAQEALTTEALTLCQTAATCAGAKLSGRCQSLLHCFTDDCPTDRQKLAKEYIEQLCSINDSNQWFPKILANTGLKELILAEQLRLCSIQQTQAKVIAFSSSVALMTVAAKILALYEELKQQHNLLDFDDLLIKANELFDNPEFCDWVLYKLDTNISHILIDEAQDTDSSQWQIVDHLAAEFFAGQGVKNERPASLFVVGDDKQSIYSFRGADPQIFSEKYQAYRHSYANTLESKERLAKINLATSFRSKQIILDLVDLVFSQPAERQAISQLNQDPIQHIAYDATPGGLIEVWELFTGSTKPPKSPKIDPQTFTLENLWQPQPTSAIQQLATTIACQIANWTQPEHPRFIAGTNQPVSYGDILILFTDRTHLQTYINALNQFGIPNSGADSVTMNDSLMFQDVLAICQFILADYDDFNLACLLKSPMFNWSEEELYQLAANRGNDHLIDRLDPQSSVRRQLIRYQLLYADSISLYEFFLNLFYNYQVKTQLQSHFGVITSTFLEQFLNLVYHYEEQYPHASLVNLLEFMQQHQIAIKRTLNIGKSNEVTLTTVHGAKGLEAPIVILPETYHTNSKIKHHQGENTELSWIGNLATWHGNRKLNDALVPSQLQEEAHYAEYLRQLYVALTRAKNELYIAGSSTSTSPKSNNSALCWYDLIRQRLQTQPQNQYLVTRAELEHRILKQSTQIAPTPASDPSSIPEFNNTSWLKPRQEHFLHPSTVAGSLLNNQQAILRGNITHKLLELLPNFPATQWPELIRNYCDKQAQIIDYPEALQKSILQILHKSEFATFFGPNSRAEVPIIGLLDGKIISGQVDRLVVEPTKITIIDYKNSVDVQFSLEKYRQQLQLYRRLLSNIYPNRLIESYIIWVDRQELLHL